MILKIIANNPNLDNTSVTRDLIANSTNPRQQVKLLSNFLKNFISGFGNGGSVVVSSDSSAVYATATITFSGAGAADDTILINGVTFTAVASGATGNQWNVGASATLSAAALAAAINASATALVNLHVTASAASGVVTLTAVNLGAAGNAVTVAEGVDGSSHMAVSSARLVNGANATPVTFSF